MTIQIVSGQQNSGSAAATTSFNVTLPAGTTAGNTVIIFISASTTPSLPTGFTVRGPTSAAAPNLRCWQKTAVDAESSWTVGSTSTNVAWAVVELEGFDNDTPIDVSAPASFQQTASAATSIASGTTGTSTTYDGLAVAVFGASTSGTTPATFSGYTNGFAELFDQGISAATSIALAVATVDVQTLGAWTTTATASASSNLAGMILVFNAAGAKKAANVVFHCGFGWGTEAGLNVGNAGVRLVDLLAGAPAIVSDGAGGYCLELSATAAAENIGWDTNTLGSAQTTHVERLELSFPSSLPAGDVVLATLETTASVVNATIAYRSASQKIGVTLASGSEVLSDAAVTAATRIGIDWRWIARTAGAGGGQTLDWQLDYNTADATDAVVQTQATSAAAGTPLTGQVRLGWTAATTATVRYHYLVVSTTSGHYPLGAYVVALLRPDAAGTVTISGTSGNFQTFTANGTMAAWNATTARDAVRELPPTIGAAADGFAQITAAASDYVEVPMETYAASGVASIRAVRMLACGWAASATAATIGFRGWEGSAETTLLAAVDTNFDNSTTAPAWVAKMYKPTGGWTQAKLDALAFRVGFSDDATPDIGIHAIYAEAAVQAGDTQPHFGGLVASTRDPLSAGILSVAVTPTSGYDATLHYEEGGTPTNVPAPGGTTTTEVIDAPDAPAVNYVALYPPPEDISDA